MKKFKTSLLLLLLFLYLGSSSIFSQSADTIRKDVFSMDLEELMNVKITTAGKKAEKISEIPASVVLLTREDIKTYGFTTLADILSNIPGMFPINDYYLPYGTFGVRGFWPGSDDRNIMIMVNGVNQVYDVTSAYNMNNITVPVQAIDRIEVIRGPMSVIYGNGAFYGVINIITNESENSQISSSIGSLKTNQLMGRAAGSQGDLKYVVNASVYNSGGIDKPISKMVTDTSILKANYGVPTTYTTGGKLEYNQKHFGISCGYKPFTFDFSYNESIGEGYYLMPSPFSGSPSYMNSTNFLVDYKKQLSNKTSIEGKFNYSAYRMMSKFDYLFKEFYGIQQTESNALESELDVFYKPINKIGLIAGIYDRSIIKAYNMYDLPSFGASTSHQYMTLNNNNSITTRALFAQLDFQPFINFKITAGLRLEQMPQHILERLVADTTWTYFTTVKYRYNQDQITLIPRLAAIYSLNEKNIIKLLMGQAINRPSFFQNTANNFDLTKPDLKPEWITTYELNYISFFSDKLMINTSLYLNVLDKLIIRTSELDTSLNYLTWFGNTGKLVTYGSELSIQINPSRKLKLELSGTYQKTKDQREGFKDLQVAYSPKLLGYLKLSYLLITDIRIGITGNYVGEMLSFYDETILNPDNTHGKRIGEKIDPFFLVGLNLRWDNITQYGFFSSIKFDNVLNREIRFPTTVNNTWADRGTLGSGTTFLFSLGKKF